MAAKRGTKKKPNVLGVRFWYTGIRVRNLEESIKFYKEALGFHVILKGNRGTGHVLQHIGFINLFRQVQS